MEWFVSCAKDYLLYGGSISEMCCHNAIVAENAGRHQVAQVWRIVGTLYAGCDNRTKSAHPSGEPRSYHSRYIGKLVHRNLSILNFRSLNFRIDMNNTRRKKI